MCWAVLLAAAPVWRARHESGAGHVMAAATYLLGSRLCHQRPDRSFRIAAQPLPVCGRCTGLYVSGALGLVTAVGVPRRRTPVVRRSLARMLDASDRWWPRTLDRRAAWLALAGLPTLATWTIELAGVWNPGSPLRAVAAAPLGVVAGWLLGRVLLRTDA